MINKYVKKPMVIEAVKWDGLNLGEIRQFVDEDYINYSIYDTAYQVGMAPPVVNLRIKTPEGFVNASVGDYICKGIKGEFYPCKPDIFEESYDLLLLEENESPTTNNSFLYNRFIKTE